MKSLKLISLNIEGNKHFHRFIPLLQAEQPDVVCLQEVFAQDIPKLATQLGMNTWYYAPMVCYLAENQYHIPPRGVWGLLVLTKLPVQRHAIHYYKGDKREIPLFVDGQPNSANRAVVVVEIEKAGVMYRIATTHFTWSNHGVDNDEQQRDLTQLMKILEEYPELIICGDLNLVRGRSKLFTKLSQVYIDHIPTDVTTTLDLELHYAAPLELVVDGLLSTKHYQFKDIKVVSGMSDHQALVSVVDAI